MHAFLNGSKGDSNPGFLDCEPGVLTAEVPRFIYKVTSSTST